MNKKSVFTKILTIAGTALVWFPILAPLFFSVVGFIEMREFQFDYLMPAEFFLVALAGGGLLLWAAFRAHSRRGLIGWSLASAVGLPVIGSVIASVTGLASGETEPTGWQWALVLAALAGYCLAVLVVGVGGVLLLRDLFRRPPAGGTVPPEPPVG